MKPLRIGIIGMGGFAGVHHDTIALLEAAGEFQLVCTCDPAMAGFAGRVRELRFAERGVRVFHDYREMLDACRADLDLVSIPTPISLHAPMHRACVERDLPVYLEKPPTLDCRELEQMIALDAGAARQTGVGFNFIIEPERQELKRRLIAGEFGRLQRVTVYALWPRNAGYFTRTDWAGRLKHHGRLILDSCVGNAMSHQVHNALFWSGAGHPWAWGNISRIRAELYRAHAIEGMDTAFIAATTDSAVELRVGMSHACHGDHLQEECVVCDRATLRFHISNSGPHGELYTICWNDGRVETGGPVTRDLVLMNFQVYASYLRGEVARPATRLIDCRSFVQLNSLAYVAAKTITTISPGHVRPVDDGFLTVEGLPEAITEFIRSGRFPGEQSLPWAAPGGSATPDDLPQLDGIIAGMCA